MLNKLLVNNKITKMGFTVLAGLVVSLLVVAGASAAVWTNQPDYQPGSVVTIGGDNSDGAGYLAGETVHVDVNGPNGYTASCDATVDDAGAWSCQITLNSDESAYGDYTYTATGQTSGVTENSTFTDAPPVPKSPIDWAGPGKGGTNDDGSCKSFEDDPDLNPGAGEQGWLFILTNSDPSTTSSELTTTFSPTTQNPSNPIAGIQKGGGSYHFIVYTTAGAVLVSASATNGMSNSQLTVSHCELGEQASSTLTTEVHLANHTVVTNTSPGTTGAMVHDQVTLTVTGASAWSGTLTLNFYTTNDCSGTPAATESFGWSNTDPSTRDNRLPQGPLADGGYSYRATFDSSTDALDKTGDCEPFKVVSSITSFWYQINGTGTEYTRTSTNLNSNYGTVASSTKGSTKYDFLVHVDVTNNSGVTQDVKVQGGLAAQATYWQSVPPSHTKGTQITSFPATLNDVSCGSAYLNLSNANNVVTWFINNMPSGTTCDLYIWVKKGYSSTGFQSVTSSWSQVDCPADTVSNEAYTLSNRSALGESKPGCVKSTYTGDLQVYVT